jgi:solute carrier family 25 phosphate transporter 3
LKTSPILTAEGPSSELHDASPVSWDEAIGAESVQLEDTGAISTKDKAILACSVIFAMGAFSGLLAVSPIGCWRYFVAGGACAAVSHAIPTPVDVVKVSKKSTKQPVLVVFDRFILSPMFSPQTRKQVDPELADEHFLQAARIIAKKEGMSVLWSGLGPTVWGYLLEGAVKFGVYEVLKPIIRGSLSRLAAVSSWTIFNSQLLAFILSGIMSGLAASIMLCPMEALRIRMVADPDFAPSGWLEGGKKILRREGVAGLVKGINPMIMKQVPYTVTKNVSFDIITKYFYSLLRAQNMAITASAKFTVPLVSAAIASVLSSITSHPGDMVLSVINAQEGDQRPADIFRNIIRSERGLKGLFVGFKTRLLHVGIIVTLQLLIYDYAKRLCGIAATGSV